MSRRIGARAAGLAVVMALVALTSPAWAQDADAGSASGAPLAAAPAASPPSPPVAASSAPPLAPAPVVSPAFTCGQSTATIGQLSAARSTLPLGFVIPAPGVAPRDTAASFTYIQPAGQSSDHLRFRVFLTQGGASGQAVAAEPGLLSVVHPIPPAQLPDAAQAAGADGQSAYLIRALIPHRPVDLLAREERLIVIACDVQAAAPVGYAQAPIHISNGVFAGVLAFVIMAGVYLMAALVRWQVSLVALVSADKLASSFSSRSAHGPAPRVSGRRGAQYNLLDYFNPVVMSADIFNRASLSQLQVLGFLLLVGYGVTYSLLRTGTLSELSSSIVYLLGIPAVGALGSAVATASQDRFSTENWSWLVSHHVLSIDDPGTSKPQWRDVLMSGNKIDLYKLQAFTFSIIVAVALLYSGFTSLQSFTVPDTLLQVLGLSHLVFIGGRFTGPATIADADKLVTELRDRASALRVAIATGVDVDATGAPQRTADPNAPVRSVATVVAARALAPNAVSRYLETANELEILLKGLTYRDVVTDALRDPLHWDAPPPPPPAARVRPGPPPTAPAAVAAAARPAVAPTAIKPHVKPRPPKAP